MKKLYKIENLKCIHCAERLEKLINKIDGINSATVDFTAGKISVEADEEIADALTDKITEASKKVEEFSIITAEE